MCSEVTCQGRTQERPRLFVTTLNLSLTPRLFAFVAVRLAMQSIMQHPILFCDSYESQLVLEVDRKRRITDADLLSINEQFVELTLQVRARLLLQIWWEGIVQCLLLASYLRLLDLSGLRQSCAQKWHPFCYLRLGPFA